MGRKIAGRKHRGIRDPVKQQATRLSAIAQKINCPPKDNDEQAIPKSLLRIQELQKRMIGKDSMNKRKAKLKKKLSTEKIGMFKRLKGETDKSFLDRVHNQTEEVLKEAKFSEKYNVDIIRNRDSGQVESVRKRPKDELGEYLKKVKSNRGKNTKSKRQQLAEAEPKLTKSQKKRQKLLTKKRKQLENNPKENKEDRQQQHGRQSEVVFGEVAHAPPTLTLPRIIQRSTNHHNVLDNNTISKPGTRNLLLKVVLNATAGTTSLTSPTSSTTDAARKDRLRNLPGLLRKRIESNQKAAIEAYRQLKVSKYKQ